MTAPRGPRHRRDDDVPAPAAPDDPPTEALSITPAQRRPMSPVFAIDPPAPTRPAGPAPFRPAPSGAVAAPPAPTPARGRLEQGLLAGLTAVVLALGVGAVVGVESWGPADAAPISGQ